MTPRDKRPKLLIATPAFGGSVHVDYCSSLVNTVSYLQGNGLLSGFGYYTLSNESFISRARDRAALYCLEHDFTHLMFIDADQSWKPEWVAQLLSADKEVIGGTYPVKTFPTRLNFTPLEGEQYEGHLLKVKHIPTGFMLIKWEILEELASEAPTYLAEDPLTKQQKQHWSLFQGGRIKDQIMLTEDWAFCEDVRRLGYTIYLDPRFICGHYGNWNFAIDPTP